MEFLAGRDGPIRRNPVEPLFVHPRGKVPRRSETASTPSGVERIFSWKLCSRPCAAPTLAWKWNIRTTTRVALRVRSTATRKRYDRQRSNVRCERLRCSLTNVQTVRCISLRFALRTFVYARCSVSRLTLHICTVRRCVSRCVCCLSSALARYTQTKER